MNGIPVYPKPKNGERPYLAPSVAGFWSPIFADFYAILSPLPIPNETHPRLIF